MTNPLRLFYVKIMVDATIEAEDADEAAKIATWVGFDRDLSVNGWGVKIDSIEDVTDKGDEG